MLLVEAIAVGILTVIIGSMVGFILAKYFSPNLPKTSTDWNKNHIMEISLFLTGFLLHISCEYSGINKWYCKNGVACKK
jgi:glycopeptide antibiotics resistance protein